MSLNICWKRPSENFAKHCLWVKHWAAFCSWCKIQASKVWASTKNKSLTFGFKQDMAALTITFAFFLHCLLNFSCMVLLFYILVWQVFGKTLKDSKSAWREWFFIGFFKSIYLTCSFFAYFSNLLWIMDGLKDLVPVTWQSGTVDKDPNGRKLGTLPYNYGHSNPPLIMATSLVRPNSYGLIVATLEGSFPLS